MKHFAIYRIQFLRAAARSPVIVAAACSAVLNLASCSTSSSPFARTDWSGPLPATKPQGLIYQPEKEDEGNGGGFEEMGPPPPGYIRITGEPVPDWDATRGVYQTRSSPFTWTFLGPRPISNEYWSYNNSAGGRVVSIAPHPTDGNTVYIASASGGIWKTTNAGTNWTPLTDDLSTLNHGAVALDPRVPTTVYAGTGEYTQGSAGDGVFRSVDSGATWTRFSTASQVGSQCSGIAVNPINSNIVHVTGSQGYCRTINGGGTWQTLIVGSCSALAVHPTDGNILYVARSGTGIYKSTTGGSSFSLLGGGLPTTGFDRIVMSLAKSNPSVLYAAYINGSNVLGLYKTADAGATWAQLTATPNFCTPQCWYDAYVGVDPTNENIAYCGGVDPRYQTAGVIKTTNGGTSWTEVSANGNGLHPDHHCIAFGPTGTVWEGCDGGISKSNTGGSSWTNCSGTLGATQAYHIIVHPTVVDRVLMGVQDNGTPERTSNSLSWTRLQVGDGGFSVFDPTNTTRRYTTYVYLAVTRWNGGTGTDITGPWTADQTNWISPIVIDPNVSTTLVAGTQRVWRTTNATTTPPTWTAISTTTVGGSGALNALAIAKGASGTIYAGNDTGGVWVTTNATAATPTWTNRTSGIVSSNISSIVISPTAPGTAFVGSYNTSGARIYRTDNTGANWRNVTGTLTSGISVRALAVDFNYSPPVMYIGAGSGVYVSFDEGATWTKDDNTFPNVNIGSFYIDTRTNTLTVGTYGRGAWRTPLAVPPRCIGDYNNDGGIDGADVQAFFLDWTAGNINADVNDDGGVDGSDVETFFMAWEAGSC